MSPHSSPKSHESRPKVDPKRPVWDPSRDPKSTKKRPKPKKALPKMAPEAVSIDFLAGLRSKSHSRSILRRSEPSKSYYFNSGSTIFTKSRFSLFHRIWTPNGTPNPFILAKNARREIPKSPKFATKVVLGSIKIRAQILDGNKPGKSGAGVPAECPSPPPPPHTPRGPTTVFQ